jgi:hypothetical protein
MNNELKAIKEAKLASDISKTAYAYFMLWWISVVILTSLILFVDVQEKKPFIVLVDVLVIGYGIYSAVKLKKASHE